MFASTRFYIGLDAAVERLIADENDKSREKIFDKWNISNYFVKIFAN